MEKIIKENENNESLNSYYSCVVKTNKMIKEKYKNKIPNTFQCLMKSSKQMTLMRKGVIPRRDIDKVLETLEKEMKEQINSNEVIHKNKE